MEGNKKIKELFFEADTRKHQQLVASRMFACIKRLIDKALCHDESKFSESEKPFYIDPVWALNNENIQYGSDQYKEACKTMGSGLKHHTNHNDHHVEFFEDFTVQTLNDPIRAMDLFAFMEMLCDWIAAAKRRGNSPTLAIDSLKKKYHIDEQLECILRNTLAITEDLK